MSQPITPVPQFHKQSSGFTLVELSIVLVIIGLLTGWVLTRQSLIRASQLRAVTGEYQRYLTAVQTFRDKYFAIPGDMTNATLYWGTATCPGDPTTPSTDTKTCNGNGDGQIGSMEFFRFWQHLANAGLIEGSYTGVPANGNFDWASSGVGTNEPASKLTPAGWFATGGTTSTPISDVSYFEGDYGVFLLVGILVPGPGNASGSPFLKPEEAYNIDKKLDDGKPATGIVVSLENEGSSSGTGCSDLAPSSSASLATSNYSLTNTSLACSFIFKHVAN